MSSPGGSRVRTWYGKTLFAAFNGIPPFLSNWDTVTCMESVAVAGVLIYLVTIPAWFALGPGSVASRIVGFVLPLVSSFVAAIIISSLPKSMCGDGMWAPCVYRAFQYCVVFVYLWPFFALVRIAIHRAGSEPT